MTFDPPKIKMPFKIVGTGIALIEQDTIEEIAQCVYTVLATEIGSRDEEPEFGITDQAHRKLGADFAEMEQAIDEWEPRATVNGFDEEWIDIKQHVRVIIDG